MSKVYCEKTGKSSKATTTKIMREHCKRPGRMDENGEPIYFTEQNHKKECDVNEIIKKYDRTGLLTHVKRIEAQFGDMTGASFRKMQDEVARAKTMFEQFPADVKKRFDNDISKLLEFMESPENREEGIKLGLIRGDTAENKDGFGEHVTDEILIEVEKEETQG